MQFSECLGCRLLTNYNFSKVTLNTIPVIIIILLGFRSQQEAAAASPRLKSLSCVGTGLAATTNTEHTLQPAWAGTVFTNHDCHIRISAYVPRLLQNGPIAIVNK